MKRNETVQLKRRYGEDDEAFKRAMSVLNQNVGKKLSLSLPSFLPSFQDMT